MFRRIVTLYTLITMLCYNAVWAQTISYSTLFDNSTFSRSIDLSKSVGAIDGASGTAPSGAATYTIPIKCPPGTNGVVPQLAVVYNSQGGNGMLGQGWSLSGLSTITRAGKDFYHDGKVSPVSYTNDDAFILDGQRLVPTSGNNGDAGTTYRTEAQSFSVITSNETIGGGPRYFNVVAKDGSIMQYGYTDDARFVNDDDSKIMMWRLNKIQDVNGNYISFQYDNSDRDSRLVKISYTGNADAGLSPYNEINFVYAQRSDESLVYDGGYSLSSKHLLWQINVTGEGGDLFKSYQFDYGKNNVGASYLKLVEEFASDNSKLNDTRFKYGEAAPDLEAKSSNINIAYHLPLDSYSNPDIISGDFDGDGKSEMLIAQYDLVDVDYYDQIFNKHYKNFTIYKQSSGTSSDFYVPLAGGSDSWSTTGKHLISFKQSNSSKSFVVSDFDGDGKDDLFFFRNTNLSGYPPMSKMDGTTIYYSRVNSSGFYFDKIDYDRAAISSPYGGEPHLLPGKNKVVLGDFDGDKRTDYLYFTRSSEYYGGVTNYTDHSFVSFPGKGELNNRLMQTGTPTWDDGSFTRGFMDGDLYVLDFDGDGTSELMVIGTTKSYIYKVSKSSSGNYFFEYMSELGYPRGDHHDIYGIGDFNADGKDDLITRVKSTNDWEIGFSNGKILVGYRFDLDPSYMFQDMCGIYPADRLYIGDYNGDGKSDLLHESCDCGNFQTKSTFNAYYFNGIGSDNKMKYTMKSYAYANKAMRNSVTEIRPIVTDLNGDGKNEISFKTEFDNEMQTLYLNKDDKSNLLEKVTDGFNRTTEFIYDPLTKGGDIYTKGSGETWPVNNGQYAIYVVTSLKTPDGIGGVTNTAFRYENLRLHRAGRGLLGFEKVRSINFTTGIETQTLSALNTGFYVPYPKTTKTFLSSDPSHYSCTTNNYDFLSDGPGKCFTQTNPSGSSEDLLTDRRSTYSNTYDSDGNITYATDTLKGDVIITTTRQANYTKVAGSPFFNALADMTVTTQRSGQPAVMDKTVLAYDNKGRLTHSYTTPNGIYDPPNTLHKYWTYDDFGNKASDKEFVLGNPYIPIKSYEYDAQGRFMTKKTNIFGDYTTYTNHKFWGPLSSTGVTGLVSTNTYDAWGKLTSTTVPVSSSVSYTLNYSDGWDPGTNQLYYTLVQDPSAPDVKTWYDNMDRAVKTQQEHSSGTWTNAWTQYDTRGNAWKKSNTYLPTETPLLVEYAYDDRNRLSTETTPTGTTGYAYSFSGKSAFTTMTLPDHKIKKSKMDASGKLVESDNGLAGTVVFDYDSRGNELRSRMKITSTSGMSFVEKEYDQWGRLTRLDDADAGKTTYKYNAFGQLLEQKDPKGKTTYFRYEDDFGRLREKELDGMKTSYTYYNNLKGYQLQQESVISTKYGTVTDQYDYTEAGNLALHTKTTNGVVTAKSFTYDGYGRPLVTEYSSGLGTRNHYDGYGFLQKITTNFTGGGPGDRILYETNARRGDGQIQRFTRNNGLTTEHTYEYGTLIRAQDLSGIHDQGVGYDFTNGNVYGRADVWAQTQEFFTYDAADRLTSSQAERTDGSGTTWPSIDLEYDKPPTSTWIGSFGRIVSKSDAGTYKYAGFPRNAVASITDPGNRVSHETQNITYTPFHKADQISEMIGVTAYQENFVYDAAEDRAYSEQVQGGVVQHQRWYMGDYELDRFAGSADQQIHYISGEGGLCAIVIKEGPVFTYYAAYTDHLGSIVLLTDETGTAIYRQSYDPWGRERDPETWDHGSGWGTKPRWLTRGYTGHEMLPEYGLINMNGRMYDPLNGRMLRPDNFVQDPSNTQSYNRYSYCWNNPMKFTDPDGQWVQFILGAAMGAFSGYQIAQSKGLKGWDKFAYIAGGAAIGAASAGASAGVSSLGASAFVAGAAGGAVGGAGFAGLQSNFNGGAMLKGAGIGALSSAVGGTFGAGIGGGWGAFASGSINSAISTALNNGNIGEVGISSLIGGIGSFGMYHASSALSYNFEGGRKWGDINVSYRQFLGMQKAMQQSRFNHKEIGGYLEEDGSFSRRGNSSSYSLGLDDVSIEYDSKEEIKPFFHTHWAREGATYEVMVGTKGSSIRNEYSKGAAQRQIAERYFSEIDKPMQGRSLMLNRIDGASSNGGSNYKIINPAILRYFPYFKF